MHTFRYPTDDQLLIYLLFQRHHSCLCSFKLHEFPPTPPPITFLMVRLLTTDRPPPSYLKECRQTSDEMGYSLPLLRISVTYPASSSKEGSVCIVELRELGLEYRFFEVAPAVHSSRGRRFVFRDQLVAVFLGFH